MESSGAVSAVQVVPSCGGGISVVADIVSEEQRSYNMSRIRCRNTKPEIAVRSALHRLGYRFTVNGPRNRSLSGRPDIVLPKYETVVFVHGCFWHRHAGCRYATTPSSREEFWQAKFAANVERDQRNVERLASEGWKVVVVWECETRDPVELPELLRCRLGAGD